jgi:hypothetical protein
MRQIVTERPRLSPAGLLLGQRRPPPRPPTWAWSAALGLALPLMGALVHAPVVGLPFIQEDYIHLARVRPASLAAPWAAFLALDEGWYRPLLEVYFALLHGLFGPVPAGFHAVNIALLALNAGLVAALGHRLGLDRGARVAAAVFYGGHTAFMTLVLWPAAASSLLVVAASLAALVVLPRAWRPARLALAAALFALALAARENAVVVPALAWLTLWLPGRPWRSGVPGALRAALAALRVTAPCWLLLGLYLLLRSGAMARMATETVYAMAVGPHLLSNASALLIQASGLPLVLVEGRPWLLVVPLGLWLGVGAGAAWSWRRGHAAPLLGLLWFAVACSPVLLLARHAMDAYYLDLPLVGLALAIGVLARAGLGWAAPRGRMAAPATIVLAGYLVLGGLAVRAAAPRAELVVKAARAAAVVAEARAAYPRLPRGGTLTLTGADDLTYWATGWGAAFQVAYDDPTLRIVFARPEETPIDAAAVVALSPR